MVDVVQLVEHLFVAQVVAGSSPVVHPIGNYRVTPSEYEELFNNFLYSTLVRK